MDSRTSADRPSWKLVGLDEALTQTWIPEKERQTLVAAQDRLRSANFNISSEPPTKIDSKLVASQTAGQKFLDGLRHGQKIDLTSSPINPKAAAKIVEILNEFQGKYPNVFRLLKNFKTCEPKVFNDALKSPVQINVDPASEHSGLYINAARFPPLAKRIKEEFGRGIPALSVAELKQAVDRGLGSLFAYLIVTNFDLYRAFDSEIGFIEGEDLFELISGVYEKHQQVVPKIALYITEREKAIMKFIDRHFSTSELNLNFGNSKPDEPKPRA